MLMKFWEDLPYGKAMTLLTFALCSVIYTLLMYVIQDVMQWWPLALSSVALVIFLIIEYGFFLERKRKAVFKIVVDGPWVPGVGKIIKLSNGSHAVVVEKEGNVIKVKPIP
jgi:hypothetical protein